jgi:hypothetical protein
VFNILALITVSKTPVDIPGVHQIMNYEISTKKDRMELEKADTGK